MTENYTDDDIVELYPDEKMGFAVPRTPAHSLQLLNSYMRTDLLRNIHLRLHQLRDANAPGSPLDHISASLDRVIDTYGSINLFECVTRNHFHIDPDYEFRPEEDYAHDIKLMKHHLKCHRRKIKELARYR